MTKIDYSLALSGGASNSVGYFKLLHELDFMKKDNMISTLQSPVFTGKYLSMVSGGIVMLIPWLCNYSADDVADMIESLKGDRWLKMKPTITEYPKWLRGLRKSFNKDAIAIAKENLTWKKIRSSHLISGKTKPLIGMCKYKDLWRVVGTDLFNGWGDGHFTAPWKELTNGNPHELLNKVGVYWFSDDGTYQYNFKTKELDKTSDHVEPLWKLYMAGWSNLRLTGKTYKLDFGRRGRVTKRVIKERAFDLGIINNKANLIDDDVVSISCVDYPTQASNGKGLFSIDAYTYLLKPAIKEMSAKPLDADKKIPFYDFSDSRVVLHNEYGREYWTENRYFT